MTMRFEEWVGVCASICDLEGWLVWLVDIPDLKNNRGPRRCLDGDRVGYVDRVTAVSSLDSNRAGLLPM